MAVVLVTTEQASEIETASFSGVQPLGFVFVCLVEDLE